MHVIPPVTSKKSDQRASYDANFICGCQVMINPCNCHNNLLTNKPLSITNCHWFTKPRLKIWYTYCNTISRNKSARPVHLLREFQCQSENSSQVSLFLNCVHSSDGFFMKTLEKSSFHSKITNPPKQLELAFWNLNQHTSGSAILTLN